MRGPSRHRWIVRLARSHDDKRRAARFVTRGWAAVARPVAINRLAVRSSADPVARQASTDANRCALFGCRSRRFLSHG